MAKTYPATLQIGMGNRIDDKTNQAVDPGVMLMPKRMHDFALFPEDTM